LENSKQRTLGAGLLLHLKVIALLRGLLRRGIPHIFSEALTHPWKFIVQAIV